MSIDKLVGLFFFLLSVYVCIESYRMGLGTLANPKGGFGPFVFGVLLGIFSFLGIMEKTPFKKAFKEAGEAIRQWRFKGFLSTLVILFGYIGLLQIFTFFICTCILIFFLYLVVEPKRVKIGILVAILSTVASYLLFKIVIQMPLPGGSLGF